MKTAKTLTCAGVILFLLAGALQAQKQSRPRTTSTPTGNSELEQEQRRQDEETIGEMPDPGFDFALVTARQANIREYPSLDGRILFRAKRGDALAVIDREPTGTWHHVILIETAVEGWMDESVIVIRFTKKPRPSPIIQSERTGTIEQPDIEVINDAYIDLNLKIGSILYVIPRRQRRTLTLQAGHHRFYGYAPGVSPAMGEKVFELGHRYTWTFWVETRRVR